jgi:hypothetical protein
MEDEQSGIYNVAGAGSLFAFLFNFSINHHFQNFYDNYHKSVLKIASVTERRDEQFDLPALKSILIRTGIIQQHAHHFPHHRSVRQHSHIPLQHRSR